MKYIVRTTVKPYLEMLFINQLPNVLARHNDSLLRTFLLTREFF